MLQGKELEIQMQFLEGMNDYLNTLEAACQEIKANRRLSLPRINAALRSAHSIKGEAGLIGFRILSDLAHRVSDFFTVLKTRKDFLEIDNDLLNLLLLGVDWLRQIVELYSEGHAVDEQWLATFCYPVFEELHIRLGAPKPEDAITILSLTESLILTNKIEIPREINGSLAKLKSKEEARIVSVRRLDELRSGELTIQRHSLKMQIERLQKLIRHLGIRVKNLERENYELRLAYDKLTNQIAARHTQYQHPFENNSEDGNDDLHILSQTVIKTIVKIQEITTDIQFSLENTDKVNRLLNKTSQQLQQSLTQVTMIPLSDLVDRFPLAVRDMSVEYGLDVQLKIEGANTLIERSILEALNEPLIQIVRNAFEHGIEDLATRRANGKAEQGLIEIKATHQGDRTVITIRDDGRGISVEKIRARALAMGLEPTLLDQATDEELLSLIFEAGFSTKLQALSGRGLDVVRNHLKQVQVDVDVKTVPGVGTTFTLLVPFTMYEDLPKIVNH